MEFTICEEKYGSKGTENVYFKNAYNDETQFMNKKTHTKTTWISFWILFKTVFLPHGYPDSVSEDYLEYQLWDSLQAFASRLSGTLAMKAVLTGIGVGDESATPLAATITWLLRDGTSMLSRIVFTWSRGTSLDYNSKQWRLFADFANDVAMCFDLLAAHAGFLSTSIICTAGVFRSLVDAAGSATRAAFVQHQARRGNLADVAAKDGSQETLVNLLGLIISITLLPVLSESVALVWLSFLIFTALHLYANYRAVRALSMQTLNQLRLSILVNRFMENPVSLPRVDEVNAQEPIIFGLLQSEKIKLGCSFKNTIAANKFMEQVSQKYRSYLLRNLLPSMTWTHLITLAVPHSRTCIPNLKKIGDVKTGSHKNAEELKSLYLNSDYILTLDVKAATIYITLKKDSTSRTEIESSFQAHVILHHLRKQRNQVNAHLDENYALSILTWSKSFTEANFPSFYRVLETHGWDLRQTLLGCDEWRANWDIKLLSNYDFDVRKAKKV